MAESFTTLIRTKFAPPRASGSTIRRQRLLDFLDNRRESRLILVLGPAGCGKTTLLAQWRQQLVTTGVDVAWYTLGSGEEELQFAAYVAGSFGELGLPIGAAGLDLYNRTGGRSFDGFLVSLANDLYDHSRPTYFVLDDFQLVTAAPIVAAVERLLQLAPSNFHLVIASRARPAWDLLRLQFKDELTEVRFEDLRFNFDETLAYLKARGISGLSSTQLNSVQELTDGWIAALQLTAFAIRKSGDAAQYVARLMESSSPIGESALSRYLESISDELDEEELTFLVRTSACRQFNQELCELITGNPRAGELLARFENEGLFVIPIESSDGRAWYRVHRAFAHHLRERLLRVGTSELGKLNALASHWFAGQGQLSEAIRHALYAGEFAFCAEIVDRAARSSIAGAHFLQLLEWVGKIPADLVKARINLLLCLGWAQLMCGRVQEFGLTLEAILAHPAHLANAAQFETELLRAYELTLRDDSAAALALLSPYLEGPPKASNFCSQMLCNLTSGALLQASRFEDARDVIYSYKRSLTPDRAARRRPFTESIVGATFLFQGDFEQARAILSTIVEETRHSSSIDPSTARHIAGLLAEALYQLNELEAAESLLDESTDLIDLWGWGENALCAVRVGARLRRIAGDPDGARRVLDQAEETAQRYTSPRVAALCLLEHVDIDVHQGRASAARETLRRLQQVAAPYLERHEGALADIAIAARTAEAQVAFGEGRQFRAIELLEPMVKVREAQGLRFQAAVLRTRLAAAHSATGSLDAALQILGSTLRDATTYGFRRLFKDEDPHLLRLLGEMRTRGALPREQERFVEMELLDGSQLARTTRKATPPAHTATDEGLTEREKEVLGLLSQAFSTKSIARALNLSIGTVKWHLRNMYGKLDAASREDAVLKARQRRLLG